MNNAVKLGVGVTGGYLLGRTKKLKLAIGLGAWLVGKRLDLSPSQLAMQGLGQLRQTPEFADLSDRLRSEVGSAGKRALTAAATSRMDSLADRLRDRNEGVDDYDDEDEPRAEDDDYDEEDELDDEDEPRAEDEEYDEEDELDDEDEPRAEDEEYDDEDDEEQAQMSDEPYPDEPDDRSRSGSSSSRKRTAAASSRRRRTTARRR
jgi:hypothetical protein